MTQFYRRATLALILIVMACGLAHFTPAQSSAQLTLTARAYLPVMPNLSQTITPPATFPYTKVIDFCGINNFAWTIGNALARSAQPPPDTFDCLAANGFTTIIRQNTDDFWFPPGHEQATVEALGMTYLDAYGLPDQTAYSPVKLQAMLQDVVARLKAGERILVHDAGGRGRMGFWEAAFMMWDGWTSVSAIDRYIEFGWKIDCNKGGNGQMQGINEIASALGKPTYYPAKDSYGTPWNNCPRPGYMNGWNYATLQWPAGGGGLWTITGVIPD
jgi:hypothetical protein